MKNKDTKNGKNKRNKNSKNKRTLGTWLAIFAFVAVCIGCIAFTTLRETKTEETTTKYKEFMQLVEDGKVEKLHITNGENIMNAKLKDGTEITVLNPKYEDFTKELLELGVDVETSKLSTGSAVGEIFGAIPSLLLSGIIIALLLRTTGSLGDTEMFNILDENNKVTFDDVAGMENVKKEVQFAIDSLKHRKDLCDAGGRPCKGIILEGPPGTGKTMLAKAIAGEAEVKFISTSGSDFIEMFVGVGAQRIRKLWKLAVKNAPCVIFIDEIDAVGGKRSINSATSESNQTINALLQRMDGLGGADNILVVAATNRVDDIDPALLRPGRFDKRLYIGPPVTKKDRDAIIEVHVRNKKLGDSITIDGMSKLMLGLTGAEIEGALNEAVMVSIQRGGKGIIELDDIDQAIMKLRVNGVIVSNYTKNDRRLVATHEAGHAVMTCLLNKKVAKVSIVAYSSGVGGVTIQDNNDENEFFVTRTGILNDLKILCAGAAAEEIFFGERSSGWSNDLERATMLADKMLHQYGLDDNMLVSIKALTIPNTMTPDIANLTENVNIIIKRVYAETKEELLKNRASIEQLVERLLKEETILDYTLEV